MIYQTQSCPGGTQEWYLYDGSGSVFDPLNYNFVVFPNCPSPKQRICAIRTCRQLINGQPRPIITSALQTEIATALATMMDTANVLLRPN